MYSSWLLSWLKKGDLVDWSKKKCCWSCSIEVLMIAAADLPAVPFYNFLHQIKFYSKVLVKPYSWFDLRSGFWASDRMERYSWWWGWKATAHWVESLSVSGLNLQHSPGVLTAQETSLVTWITRMHLAKWYIKVSWIEVTAISESWYACPLTTVGVLASKF